MVTASIGRGRKGAALAAFAALTLAGKAIAESDGEDGVIVLEDFADPQHEWVEMNDPVMGGKSTGTFSVDDAEQVGTFHGSVEIVSFLNAPGFIKAETTKGESWPDASSCDGLRFVLKSSTPSYEGFRVSFGSKRPPGAMMYTYGFKTDLKLDGVNTDYQTVDLPFDQFTDKWDAGTGDAVVTCADNEEFCPKEADKKELYSIAVWGEGVEGMADLQIKSVAAYGCKADGGDGSDADSSSNSDGSSDGDTSSDSESSEDVAIVTVSENTPSGGSDITIEDFSNPTREWRTMNDPVMGGQSTSSVAVTDGVASFKGTCAIVSFLHAPGFVTMQTGVSFGRGQSASSTPFPDVSSCQGLALTLRSTVDYEGYYVSFGTDKAPGGRYAMGYKAPLQLGASDDYADIQMPFTDFSDNWDDGTGKTKVSCQDDSRFCPSPGALRDMKTLSFWGEGVEGDVALDIKHIGAYGCEGVTVGSAGVPATDLDGVKVGSAGVPATNLVAAANLQAASGPPRLSNMALLAVAACSMVGAILGHRYSQRSSVEYREVDDIAAEAGLA